MRKYPCHIDFFEKCAYNAYVLVYEVTSQDEFVRKVSENMADKEIIEKLADECGGIFHTSDLVTLGYNTYAIRKMVDEQIIERIKQGYCKR